MKTNRLCPGYYLVTDGELEVEVIKKVFFDGPGWIAIARWSKVIFTDPQTTKRQALVYAVEMINEQKGAHHARVSADA